MVVPVEPRYRDGALRALPIGLVVGGFGVSFGLLARAHGFGAVAPVVMSATTFAGSAQFATVSVLSTGGSATAAIVAAVLLNARYAPISITVARLFPGRLGRRLVESQLIVDESWALSSRAGTFDRRLLVGAGLLLYTSWVVGTALGVLFGSVLGDPKRIGLDAAFPALFLALLARQLTGRYQWAAALLGAAIAIVLIPFTSPGVPIVAASTACLIGLQRS